MLYFVILLNVVAIYGLLSDFFAHAPAIRLIFWAILLVLTVSWGVIEIVKPVEKPPTYREPNPPVYSRLR